MNTKCGRRGGATLFVISAAVALGIWFSGFSYGMTVSQLKNMPGSEALYRRTDQIFRTYGIPSSIVDLGVRTGQPQARTMWGSRELFLSEDQWNLIYTEKSQQTSVPGQWINPQPNVMPLPWRSVVAVTLFAYDPRKAIPFGDNAGPSVRNEEDGILLSHVVCRVSVFMPQSITLERLRELYGDDYRIVTDEIGKSIARYRVEEELRDEDGIVNTYIIDFPLLPGGLIQWYRLSAYGLVPKAKDLSL